MPVPPLLKEVVFSFLPFRYKYLSELKFRKSFGYLSKLLLIALLLAGLVSIPKIFMLKSSIVGELDKFSAFEIDGNLTTSAPITVPRVNPALIIDLASDRNLSDESFLITRDNIQYRFFGKNSVPMDAVVHATENKHVFSGFLTAILLMFVPAIMFFLYVYLWIKYFLLVFLGATIFFVLLELTRWRMKWKQLANIAAHAVTLPLLLEVISSPFDAGYLLPSIKFLGTYVYLVPLGLFCLFMIVGVIFSHFEPRPKRKKK